MSIWKYSIFVRLLFADNEPSSISSSFVFCIPFHLAIVFAIQRFAENGHTSNSFTLWCWHRHRFGVSTHNTAEQILNWIWITRLLRVIISHRLDVCAAAISWHGTNAWNWTEKQRRDSSRKLKRQMRIWINWRFISIARRWIWIETPSDDGAGSRLTEEEEDWYESN